MSYVIYQYRITLLTIFINLLNDLSEGRRLHFHPHHGEDSSHLEKKKWRHILYMIYRSYYIYIIYDRCTTVSLWFSDMRVPKLLLPPQKNWIFGQKKRPNLAQNWRIRAKWVNCSHSQLARWTWSAGMAPSSSAKPSKHFFRTWTYWWGGYNAKWTILCRG